MNSIKDVVHSSVEFLEFDKHLQKAGVRQTPAEGRRTYRPKRCGNSNKDEDSSPKTLNDKNHPASSQKFRQIKLFLILTV